MLWYDDLRSIEGLEGVGVGGSLSQRHQGSLLKYEDSTGMDWETISEVQNG